jgi:hypothetical protein
VPDELRGEACLCAACARVGAARAE